MKKLKKYSIGGLFLLLIVMFTTGSPAAAATHSSNASWIQNNSLNQLQIQNMNQLQRQVLTQLLTQLRLRLLQLLDQIERSNITDSDSESELVILTRTAAGISDEDVLLRGTVSDFNRSDYADVWFEYDTDRRDLEKRTPIERIRDTEDSDFERRVTNLSYDTIYYFRAVGRDDEGGRDMGSVLSFRTDDRSGTSFSGSRPSAVTLGATSIEDDRARLQGRVIMNDFENGEVFFVYGEDARQVEDVESDFDSYAAVMEDGDDLQKVRVDADLDASGSYQKEVRSLTDNTDYHFSICVGYEEGSDDRLRCGTPRTFTTK